MDKKELNDLIDKVALTGPGGIDKIKKILKTILEKGGSGSGDVTQEELQEALAEKQDVLKSGATIKTINNISILGQGNIAIPKGEKGDIGDTPNFTVGNVTTGEPNTPVVVTITGTKENPVLNFTIPKGLRGEQGDTGVSADYPITVYNRLDSDATDEALAAAQGKVLNGKISQLQQNVDESEQKLEKIQENFDLEYSVNLFDKTAATVNRCVRYDTGALAYDPDYYASDYIYIEDGVTQIAVTSGQSYVGVNGIAFYDANKTFIRGTTALTVTVPAGAKYVRVSIKATLLDTSMIVYGVEVPQTYQPYGAIISAKLKPITLEDTDFSVLQRGKNLLNPELLITGKWIAANGTTENVTNLYGYYDWTEVEPETSYHISNKQGGALSNRNDCYIAFYNSSKLFISSVPSNVTDITTPALCRYVRISVVIARNTDAQMEIGNARTSYEPYSPPQEKINPVYIIFPQNGVGTENIKDGAVTQQKLAGNVSAPPRPVEFKGLQNNSDNIAVGSYIETELVYITKNTLFVAEINGTIQSVKCGVGRNSYLYEGSIEITPTELIVKKGSGTTTFSHGLTLGNRTIATISKNNEPQVTIKIINDYGAIFSQTVSWGSQVGRPFLLNNNTSGNISAKIQFMPRDINQKIWMFGDSYFSFDSSERWPYYMLSWGYNQWLADARGGESATEGLADFQVLLGTGKRPSFAVWCLGMNQGADSGGSVNTTWMQTTNAFLTLCEEYHITPILATIPSVPSEIHTKLNEWVRASGYRYIDFAKAVENGVDYYWKGWGTDGQLLSNDEVHPSVKGAIVLASQAMIDFPEISIVE